MFKPSDSFRSTFGHLERLWGRLREALYARADRHVEEWSTSLQYRRRYTNPDEAKLARGSW